MKKLLSYILLTASFLQGSLGQPICNVTEYGENDGLAQWHVTQIVQDKQGMIWLSTWNGLNRFDGQNFHCFKSQPGDGCEMNTDRIRNLWIDKNNNIQCLTDDGCFEFNIHSYTFSKSDSIKKRHNESWALGKKNCIEHTDNYGTKWLIYESGKLEYIDKKTGNAVNYEIKGIPDNNKFCFCDKQGNLWLFGNYNIHKLSFGINPTYALDQKESGEIRSLMLDSKNRYWVSNKNDKTIRLYSDNNDLFGYLDSNGKIRQSFTSFGHSTYCITQTANGTIWLGTKPNGLFRLIQTAEGSFSIKAIKGLSNNNVYDIKEDDAGRLWIATLGGGVNCITNPESDKPEIINIDNGLQNHPQESFIKVRNLLITDNHTILATTTDGLMVIDIDNNNIKNSRFHRHIRDANRANSLSSNATMHLCKDSKGRIFVCTESGGLNMITSSDLHADTLSFKHFNTHSGLPTDVMISATPYADKMLIVCSNRVLILNPTDGSHTSYSNSFFKKQYRFSDAPPIMLPDGRWLFATHDGAFAVNPDSMKKSDFIPPIALTSISIENSRTEMAVNNKDTLVLTANERNTTINFAALDYNHGGRISYAFRLNQDDNESKWNNIGHDCSVTLLNLSPGTYTLQLRSTNSDGIWTDNARSLTIIVEPKWHETMLARILFMLLTLTVIVLITLTVLYIRKLNRRQHETLEAYLALLSQKSEQQNTESSSTSETHDLKSAQPQIIDETSDAFMKRVITFVEENIDNANVSISDMADAAAVSRSGLQRKMKSLLGVTPLDFLREARIKRACQLLQTTTKSISDIAYECGFSDPKYFSRSFKASTGKSPSEYRDMM